MRGRYTGCRSIDEWTALFPIDETEAAATVSQPVVPSRQVLAIVRDHGKNRLKPLHWGLVPSWARDTGPGQRLINARAETVAVRPSFKDAFRRRRCLIPADGFFECRAEKAGRQCFYFTLPDSSPFAFAGIWERWDDRGKADAIYLSCAIITTAASGSVAPVHHRMPAILDPGAYTAWLDPENRDARALETLLKTALVTELSCRRAPRKVDGTVSGDPARNLSMTQMTIDFKPVA